MKRYILTNRNIVDTHLDDFYYKENKEYIQVGKEYGKARVEKIIATSEDVFDLIRENDYVLIYGKLYNIRTELDFKDFDDYDRGKPYEKLVIDNITKKYQNNVLENFKEDISAIYKWRGKNLACVWEKEESK